ncbi:hypothetical protein BIU97_10435 [Curtobacterium sp. MCBA15_009]|uniref:hypothetical protein n=1 Tax=Curtobacterium sp. MCBA15_009 TaxID=1898737 RepID=UPI0008DC7B2A|nr:hypothetical protein [Curtobacterium sp. MCBA15_009]OII10536.1 hypothetical protein BIU97_10435 [Curtobacterium sp. MCBA15_009]
MADTDPVPDDLEWSESSEPEAPPEYPEGPIGDLMRQRDAAQAEAERYRGLAAIYEQQAGVNQATADQLQTAIHILSRT